MKDLIKIEEKEGQLLVDARELWKGLQSKQEFANWVKSKVVNNPYFIQDEDYTTVDNIINDQNAQNGLFEKKDYALTVDTAKKVAMSEQTKVGNQVREYFIECEKTLLKVLPSNFSEALRMLQAGHRLVVLLLSP